MRYPDPVIELAHAPLESFPRGVASAWKSTANWGHTKCFCLLDVTPKKILVIDDDEVFLLGTSLLLRGEGFEVATARNGTEAVEALRQGRPDLILLDIFFSPRNEEEEAVLGNGFRIMDWLHCVLGEANVAPVLLLTASDQHDHIKSAHQAGAAGLFQKTVNTSELMDVIHQLLD